MADEEASIARTQLQGVKADGTQGARLGAHQQRGIRYLDERILIFILALAMIGLLVLWLTATSPLLLYGSLAAVILLIFLWGAARIKRIEREREQRAREAAAWKSEQSK